MPFEAVPLSPADEKRIARDLSPPVAWPTLALAVVLPTTFWGLAALGFAGVMALWLCVPARSGTSPFWRTAAWLAYSRIAIFSGVPPHG